MFDSARSRRLPEVEPGNFGCVNSINEALSEQLFQ